MLSGTAKLLDRLELVRESSEGAWLARCPAHTDKRPSLSIREVRDGTLLIHCFAGCDTGAVLTAIGLELRDLFPRSLKDRIPPSTQRIHYHAACEALRTLRKDSLIVAIAAADVAAGRPISDHDIQTLFAVATRARRIAELVYGLG
jgi:hypothetical protein